VTRRLLVLTSLAALLLPVSASAEWLLSPFVGMRFGGDTSYLDPEVGTEKKKFVWGASLALLTSGVLGVEADFSYIPGFFEGEESDSTIAHSRAITLMGNVIIALPLDATRGGLRPYVVGGVGLLHVRAEDPAVGLYSAHANVFGLNVGGGALGPLTQRSSIRFDVRHFRNVSSGDQVPVLNTSESFDLSFWRATIGVAFRY
jgi:opacity protein-like surface antigen